MRHPSERFIKYLMTSPGPVTVTDQWVQHTIASLGFPKPEDEYVVELRKIVEDGQPKNFQPTNRLHRESVRFLKEHGIRSLYHPDAATKDANLLVTNLRARPLVESLLLGRMEPRDIAKRVNARLGEFFTTEMIEAYRHYYWDVSLLKIEDWSKLLSDYEVQRQQAMAIVQVGPSMALHKMGFTQQIESKTMLREMMEGVYFDFREWKTQPISEKRTRALTACAKAAVLIDDRLSQSDSALKDSLRAFEQFRMQHAEQSVMDMRKLAPSGNYTGSGAKLLDAHKEETDGRV